MNFSTGQIIFMVAFIAAFFSVLVWAYLKDSRKTRHYYKGSYKAVIGIVAVGIAVYILVRLIMKMNAS